jgi:soluble P-type ATPase
VDFGAVIAGKREIVEGLRKEKYVDLAEEYDIELVHGSARSELARVLGASFLRSRTGADKLAYVQRLGPAGTAAIGNGANDAAMMEAVALGVVVVGPEGAAPQTVRAADVLCASVLDALRLLRDPQALAATLRR